MQREYIRTKHEESSFFLSDDIYRKVAQKFEKNCTQHAQSTTLHTLPSAVV